MEKKHIIRIRALLRSAGKNILDALNELKEIAGE